MPEHLVWLPIASAALFLLSTAEMQSIALGLLLISVLLYAFQGLAVCFTLCQRWRLHQYVRIMMVFFFIIQGYYGLLALAALGISDIWLNKDGISKENAQRT